mmetsp:Transcript_16805/g.43963  ORF Transcript_16805/g.43963 Transcript_16805/m.43963 type:complete len:380 (-) Transcript_16805:600-1739(-)
MGQYNPPVPPLGYTVLFAGIYAAALVATSIGIPGGKLNLLVASATAQLPGQWGVAARDLQAWWLSWAPLRDMPQEERMRLLVEENKWKNDLCLGFLPEPLQAAMPHFVQTWVRCFLLCAVVYYVMSAMWTYYVYYCFGDKLFQPGTIPAFKDVMEQMKVSSLAMPLYSFLPAFTELISELGLTLSYPRIENLGLPMYCVCFFMYMVSVEFGVYWMHRLLHDIKWAYKYLHNEHHKYNKEHTLSPFAGLAFHPVDGILQAVPYTFTLLFCPMHFLTHEILLFFTGVWTTNIHDNLHAKVYPIMGAGYHTIHHTSYKHNYGHYTVFFDQLYGTMLTPEEEQEEKAARKQRAVSPAGSVSGALDGEEQSLGSLDAAKAVKAH